MTAPKSRRARERDVARLIELYAELDLHHREAHPEFYATEYAPREEAWVKETLADPKVGLFVSETTPGEISGFARILEVTVWAFNDVALELYENREFQRMRHYLRKQLG